MATTAHIDHTSELHEVTTYKKGTLAYLPSPSYSVTVPLWSAYLWNTTSRAWDLVACKHMNSHKVYTMCELADPRSHYSLNWPSFWKPEKRTSLNFTKLLRSFPPQAFQSSKSGYQPVCFTCDIATSLYGSGHGGTHEATVRLWTSCQSEYHVTFKYLVALRFKVKHTQSHRSRVGFFGE
jgi:hypothetical protein